QHAFLLTSLICKKSICIQRIVAEELEKCAVEGIAAALGDHVDVRAGSTAIRGIHRPCLDLEFLDRIGIGNSDPTSGEVHHRKEVIGRHAVHLEVVVSAKRAIDAKIALILPTGATTESCCVSYLGCDSRRQYDDIRVVACYKGQIGHL